jgi:hypothetical protein
VCRQLVAREQQKWKKRDERLERFKQRVLGSDDAQYCRPEEPDRDEDEDDGSLRLDAANDEEVQEILKLLLCPSEHSDAEEEEEEAKAEDAHREPQDFSVEASAEAPSQADRDACEDILSFILTPPSAREAGASAHADRASSVPMSELMAEFDAEESPPPKEKLAPETAPPPRFRAAAAACPPLPPPEARRPSTVVDRYVAFVPVTTARPEAAKPAPVWRDPLCFTVAAAVGVALALYVKLTFEAENPQDRIAY